MNCFTARCSLLLLYLVINPFMSAGQIEEDVGRRLTEYLKAQHRANKLSGVLQVTNGSGRVWEKAVGKASEELGVPLTPSAKFPIASITKSFTALLISLAVREGRIALEDTLAHYVPDLPDGRWRRVTLGQLLGHTSGIPHWDGWENYWTEAALLPLNRQQILEAILRMEVGFEPGSRFAYSSPAYYLLAQVLEEVYQESYAELLRERITGRLGLKGTGVLDGLAVLQDRACGYHLLPGDSLIVAPPRHPATMLGGGSMYATAADLTGWCRSFLTDAYWGEEVVDATFSAISPYRVDRKNGARYGRGWYLQRVREGRPEVFHANGGTFGFTGFAAIYPAQNTSVVLLCNVSRLPIDKIRDDIEDILFGLPLEMPRPTEDTIRLSPDQLARLTGVYRAENGMELQILLLNERLHARLGDRPPFSVVAVDLLTFHSSKLGVELSFSKDRFGTIDRLVATGRGRTDLFLRR